MLAGRVLIDCVLFGCGLFGCLELLFILRLRLGYAVVAKMLILDMQPGQINRHTVDFMLA